MVKSVTTFSYIAKNNVARCTMLCVVFCLLSGCLGGTVAQQIVRSIATSIADNAVATAMDVNENPNPNNPKSITLMDRPPSDLALALTNTSFRKASTVTQESLVQEIEKPLQMIKTNALVRVTVFNIIIGQEKELILDKARRNGTLNLPTQQVWDDWHLATGKIENNEIPITFIMPSILGKPISGSVVIVELSNADDVNIARYNANPHKIHQAMDETSTSWK